MTALPRVLVTGATGFVGRHVVRALSDAGFYIRTADRKASRHASIKFAESVLLPDLSQAFDGAPLVQDMDCVVHLAGIAHATREIPEHVYDSVNAEAAARLALVARDAGVRRFVFVSSVRAQTSSSAVGVVTEQQAPQPTDAYGRSKLKGEALVAAKLSGSATDFVILRPVLVYGQGVKGNMATLIRLARGPLPLPLGAFKARRSIVSVQSLAGAVVHSLTAKAAAGGTFLVAEKDALSIAEIVSALRSGLGRKPGLVSISQAAIKAALQTLGRTSDVDRLFGDLEVSASALENTGWCPVHTSREGLALMMQETFAH